MYSKYEDYTYRLLHRVLKENMFKLGIKHCMIRNQAFKFEDNVSCERSSEVEPKYLWLNWW